MKSMKKLAASLSALGLLAAAAPSFALPALTFKHGATTQTVDPFGGFDYISNASAVVTGFNVLGNPITTTYLASAVAVLDSAGNVVATPGIQPPAGGSFEFTVKATITETATCIDIGGPTGCNVAKFTATGGSWEVYYDSTPNADRDVGTGYLDGTKILSGSILPGVAGTFTAISATTGSGNFTFFGDVSFTETDSTKDAYFNPALTRTVAGAEIKIGDATTSWQAPTSWGEGGGIPTGALVFQADGNQSFRIPEPTSVALVGLSLLGLAATRRRRV
jgi:hypothetical protein